MKKEISYSDKLKALRPFVDFNYDLRKELAPQSKAKINKYYRELIEAQAQPHRLYRARDKSKLNAVKQATGFTLKGFKVAVIPNPNPADPYKVKFNKGGITFSNRATSKIFIPFNMTSLAEDNNAEINKALKKAKGNLIAIACGKFEYSQRYQNKEKAKEKMLQFIGQYTSKNHHWQNWLIGVYDIQVKNQEKLTDEMIKKSNFKKLAKRNGKKKNSNRGLRN